MSVSERYKQMSEVVRKLDGKIMALENEVKDVVTKVKNKHVICLVGRTGAGKSTLACHLLGDELFVEEDQNNNGRIMAKAERQGFKIGQLRSSETRGANIEEIPNCEGDTVILDLAGHDGTDHMDVPNAIFRAKVLNAAASVRLVLVMPALRFDIQCGRRDAVTDIESITSLLMDERGNLDADLLESVGLIVHEKPAEIKNQFLQPMERIKKHLDDLNKSVQVGEEVNHATKLVLEKMCEWSTDACKLGKSIARTKKQDPIGEQRREWLQQLQEEKTPIWIPDVLDHRAGADLINLLLSLTPNGKEEDANGKFRNRINWPLPRNAKNKTLRHLDDAIEAMKRHPGTELTNAAAGVASLLHICKELAQTGIVCEADERSEKVVRELQNIFDQHVQKLRQSIYVGELEAAKDGVQMLFSMDSIREEVRRKGVDELPAPNTWWPDASMGVKNVLKNLKEKELDKKRCTAKWNEKGAREVARVLVAVPALGEDGEQLKQDFLSAVKEASKHQRGRAMRAVQDLNREALMKPLQWFEGQEQLKAQLEAALGLQLPIAFETLETVKAAILRTLEATSTECVQRSYDSVDPTAKATLQQLHEIYSSEELQRLLGSELAKGNVNQQLLEAMPSEGLLRKQLEELGQFSEEASSNIAMDVDDCLERIGDFLRRVGQFTELRLCLPAESESLCHDVELHLTDAARKNEQSFIQAIERARDRRDADRAVEQACSNAHSAIRMLSTISSFPLSKRLFSSDFSISLRRCFLQLNRVIVETLTRAKQFHSISSCSCRDDEWMGEMAHCFDLWALLELKPKEVSIGEKPSRKVAEALDGLVKHCEEAHQFLAQVQAEEVEKLQELGMDKDGWWETLQKQLKVCSKPRVRLFLSPQLLQPIEEKHTASVVDWYSGVLGTDLHANSLNAHSVVQAMMFETSELFLQLQKRKKLNHPETVRDKVDELVEGWRRADANASKDSIRHMKSLAMALRRMGDGTLEIQEELKELLKLRAQAKSDTENLFYRQLQEKEFESAAKRLKHLPEERSLEQAKGLLLEEFIKELAKVTRLLTQGIEDKDTRAKVKEQIRVYQSACADESCEPLAEFVAADCKAANALQTMKDAVSATHKKAKRKVELALDNHSKEGVEVGLRQLSICLASVEEVEQDIMEEYAQKKMEMLSTETPALSTLVALLCSCDVACKTMPLEAHVLSKLHTETDRLLEAQLQSTLKQIQTHQDEGDLAVAAALDQEAHATLHTLQEMQLPRERGLKSLEWARTNLGELSNKEHLEQLSEDLRRRFRQDERSMESHKHLFTEALERAANGFRPAIPLILERMHSSLDCLESRNDIDQDFFKHLAIVQAFLGAVGDQPPTGLARLRQRAQRTVEDCQKKVGDDWECMVKGMEEAASKLDVVAVAGHLERRNGLGERTSQHVCFKGRFDECLTRFWTRLEELLQRVCSSMERLNPNDLPLGPLEQVMRSSKILSRHQHNQLMYTAPTSSGSLRPSELQDWMHNVIAEPLSKLWDANEIKKLLDKESFDEIAQRLKVGEMIHKQMDSEKPKIDFIMTRIGELERQALDILQCQEESLDGFDTAFRILEGLVRNFREGQLADRATQACDNIERAVDKLLAPVEKEACSASLDAVGSILRLRTFASNAPVLHERVKKRLETVWKSHKKEGSKHVLKLGMALQGEQIGMSLVAEYPQFFGNLSKRNYVERLRTSGNLQPDVVVGGLSRHGQTAISQEESKDLLKMLQTHEDEMTSLLFTKYLGMRRKFTEIVEIMRKDLHDKLGEFNRCKSKDTFRELLTQLAACYSVLYSGESYLEADVQDQENVLVRPHAVQMLCLFELLDMHSHSQGSLIQWIVGGAVRVSNVQNRLVELRTGGGKSITLGLLSTILAKAGVPCDIVCYSEYLSQRDEEALKKLHKFAGVDKDIRYRTFDQLFRERLESIQKATEHLIESSEPLTRPSQQSGKRVLLMDEVDIFFSRRFYGDTWDGAIILQSEEAKALARYIFKQYNNGIVIRDISATTEFKNVAARYPRALHATLLQQACDMAYKVTEAGKMNFETKDGKVGYKTKDDVDFAVRHENLTVFHYLQAEENEGIDATPHLGIDLCCGSFSFASLPLNNYSTILGVTGTLKDLMDEPGSAEILCKEYKIIHNSYIPSVWGRARLVEKEVLLCKSEADWINSINREAHQLKALGHPVLIFFKNFEMLHKFPNCGDFHQLTERTPKPSREGVVSAATMAQARRGRITLLTRAFGRGVDFRIIAPETAGSQEATQASTEAVVIQTFLSSMASEETQVKGRTARMGRPGTYLRVYCEEHLTKKFKISQEELSTARKDGKLNDLLLCMRHHKVKTKCYGRSDRKKDADALERQTQEWEKLLFDPAKPRDKKLERLLQFQAGGSITHYTLLLDMSGSMSATYQGTRRWDHLAMAVKQFREALCNGKTQPTSQVSVVYFSDAAIFPSKHHMMSKDVPDIPEPKNWGGTNFAAAWKACQDIISLSTQGTRERIIFFTDGADGRKYTGPTRAIQDLLNHHGTMLARVTCIAFGDQSGEQTLEEICQMFRNEKIEADVKKPQSANDLVDTFVQAANRALHV